MTAQLSTSELIYTYLTEKCEPGFRFSCRELIPIIKTDHGKISGGVSHLVNNEVVTVVGKQHSPARKAELVCEYVGRSHGIRFGRAKPGMHHSGYSGPRHSRSSSVEWLDSTLPKPNGHHHHLDVRQFFQPPKPLSSRLLDFAIDLDLRRKKRFSAIRKNASGKGKKRRVPAIATRSMIDQLTNLAIEIERLEQSHKTGVENDGSGI